MHVPRFLRDLIRRRVPQILGAYLGAGLALIPFVGFLVSTYDLPRAVLNATLVAYISVIPSVFLLAYNHGAPGKDPWVLAERVGVPINLLLTVGLLLYTAFSTDTAEARLDTVVITDEAGNQQERLVPKAKYLRKLALYFWDNATGDASLDLLRYGFPLMLERDLEQNRFISASTPFADVLLTRLRRAGFDDALGVPVALQQEIADELGLPRFAAGRFETSGEGLAATLTVYETETADVLAEHTVTGADPAALVDQLTDRLKIDLEVEDIEGLGRDLPVSEQLSASRPALDSWLAGVIVEELDNDFEAASARWREAVAEDPTFAVAHLDLGGAQFLLGKTEAAKEALRDVQKHKYRLGEREQYQVRGLEAIIDRDNERAIKSYETLVKLYPDDVTALNRLALNYAGVNRIDDAITTYQRILDFDPAEDWAWKEIGDLHIARRDWPAALESYTRYAAGHEGDADIQFSIAQLQQAQGDLDGARTTIEAASLLADDPITPVMRLVELDQAKGDIDSAFRRLDRVAGEAEVPQDVAQVLNSRLGLLVWTGQIQQAIDLLPELRETQMKFSPPVSVQIWEGMFVPAFHGLLGLEREGEAWIEAHWKKLSPPYDQFQHLSYLQLYTLGDNAEGIERHVEDGRRAIQTFSPRNDSLAQIEIYRGRALELRGQFSEAAAAYKSMLESLESSTLNLTASGLRAQCLNFHARAAIDAGDLAAAEESLLEALRTLPAHPNANYERARLEQKRGNLDAARDYVQAALAVWKDADPGYRPAADARSLADELAG